MRAHGFGGVGGAREIRPSGNWTLQDCEYAQGDYHGPISYDLDGRIPGAESGATMRTDLLRFNGAVERDAAIDAWMRGHAGELGGIAQRWFDVMRKCGDEVRELLHDGCPVACLGDAPFGYVNVFTSHVNVGFFHGAALADPGRLLQGTGKFMRHVKLRPGTAANAEALSGLIDAAYADIKARVENG